MLVRAALTALLVTASATAEDMDKEPTLPEIWFGASFASFFARLLGRYCPGLGWLCMIPLLPALLAVEESYDKSVGPAILHEAGSGYVAQAHLAVGLAILAYASGFTHRRKARPGLFIEGIQTRE